VKFKNSKRCALPRDASQPGRPGLHGRWFSVGAIEQKFYGALLDVLELSDVDRSAEAQWDRACWIALHERITAVFRTRERDTWTRAFEGQDACGAPVLEVVELADDPHFAARRTVVRSDAGFVAAAAPRLSPRGAEHAESAIHGDARALLAVLGVEATELEKLTSDGTLAY
jgi:alpha-methylacyl-CoA racemase